MQPKKRSTNYTNNTKRVEFDFEAKAILFNPFFCNFCFDFHGNRL